MAKPSLKSVQKSFGGLCKPAQLYVAISVVSIVAMMLQNMTDARKYCVGMYECDLEYNNIFVFIVQFLYVLFWTIVLDSLCKNGYTNLSWIIVLLPFVTFFILIGLFILSH